jgi:hypothetical protein
MKIFGSEEALTDDEAIEIAEFFMNCTDAELLQVGALRQVGAGPRQCKAAIELRRKQEQDIQEERHGKGFSQLPP